MSELVIVQVQWKMNDLQGLFLWKTALREKTIPGHRTVAKKKRFFFPIKTPPYFKNEGLRGRSLKELS